MQLDILLANPTIVNGTMWSHWKHAGIFEHTLQLENSTEEVIKLVLNAVTPLQLDHTNHF